MEGRTVVKKLAYRDLTRSSYHKKKLRFDLHIKLHSLACRQDIAIRPCCGLALVAQAKSCYLIGRGKDQCVGNSPDTVFLSHY